MSILTQRTELEIDLSNKDKSILRCVETIHHLAATLCNENQQFWSLPTDRLLAVLNHDVSSTNATFAANTEVGVAVNNILDQLALPQFQSRAPVTAGRTDIVFNGTVFEHIPAPQPATEPEPEPELDPNI